MKELKWRIDWHLGVGRLDVHHKKILEVINELTVLADIKEYKGQPVNRADSVVSITAAKQLLNIQKSTKLVDELFLPLICDLKDEIIAYFSDLEVETELYVMDSHYHFYKKDLMMLMTDLKQYINHIREVGSFDSQCTQQMSLWFILHMRCLKKMLVNINQLQYSRQLLGAM